MGIIKPLKKRGHTPLNKREHTPLHKSDHTPLNKREHTPPAPAAPQTSTLVIGMRKTMLQPLWHTPTMVEGMGEHTTLLKPPAAPQTPTLGYRHEGNNASAPTLGEGIREHTNILQSPAAPQTPTLGRLGGKTMLTPQHC